MRRFAGYINAAKMSSQLVWQIVKKNNSFIRKGLNGELFSAEKGNLTNKHSYKFSGAEGFTAASNLSAAYSRTEDKYKVICASAQINNSFW